MNQVTDPSGRNAARPVLGQEQIEANAATYTNQVFKVLNRERTKVMFNSNWLTGLSLATVIKMASSVTVRQMLDRDDFKIRLDQGLPLSLHETLYPLLQGWDSVALRADVEIGGTDQLFNLQMGRVLQRANGQEPQVILTMPILEGTNAKEPGGPKMSKSAGNYIGMTEEPNAIFHKVMQISDTLMWRSFELLADWEPEQVAVYQKMCREHTAHPKTLKADLAQGIVTDLYGFEVAQNARFAAEAWLTNRVIDESGVQQIRLTLQDPEGIPLHIAIREAGFASSSEASRKIKEGAVHVAGVRVGPEIPKLKVGKFRVQYGRKVFADITVEDKV